MSDYLRWQDLVDEDDGAPVAVDPRAGSPVDLPSAAASARADTPAPPPEGPPPSPELRALMEERRRLEQRMQELVGGAPKEAGDERLRRCFPVFVHTVATRLEARRFARRDEEQRVLRARALERRSLAARVAEAALEESELARLRRIVERRLSTSAQASRAELLAERARLALEEAELRERWATQHREAVEDRKAQARREAGWHDARNEERGRRAAEAAAELLSERAREDAARHRRLDELRERALARARAERAAEEQEVARRARSLQSRRRAGGDTR